MARRKAKSPYVDDSQVYQLKITLKHSKPPIWRRVQVRGSYTLFELHIVIQIAMGWSDSHLHQFAVRGTYFGEPEMDWGLGPEIHDETAVRLDQIAAQEGARIAYEYDFGDGWEHLIVAEKILPVDPDAHYPVCLTGRRACPPEDVGGIWGYFEFLEAINDPAHPGHDEWLEWVGGSFDPQAFDLDEVNSWLRQVAAEAKFGQPVD